MAFPVNTEGVYKIDCLPAKLSVEWKAPKHNVIRALFRDKKCIQSCWLTVTTTGTCVVAELSDSLLCFGPGKYYVDLMDGCHVCKTVCVRLESECFIEVKSVEVDDEIKEPYWKRKANG
jgi:hypothetical protein